MDECEYEVRISDPGEVAAALPHLLGFRPEESVVIVGLGGPSGGRVGLTVRADIPPPRHAAPLATALARGVVTDEPAAVLIVVVSEASDEPGFPSGPDLPHRGLVHALVGTLAAQDIPVRDVLLVRRGRWWSYDCPHPCCDPAAGTLLPGGVTELEVASVATGQVVAQSREELEARIARVTGSERSMTAAHLRVSTECSVDLLERGAAVAADSWTAILDAAERSRAGAAQRPLTDAELMRVVWGLSDPAVRDR